jgi:hypothetical protein
MTQDEIMEMWNSITKYAPSEVRIAEFAKLVAKHTLSNIGPSKFMSCQEVMEAARMAEREACAQIADKHTKASFMGAVGAEIRARGEQA